MFAKIHKRVRSEKGFTLIELLVVIIIIAILAAIAIPTFLGQRQKAQDAAAKSLVRNAMTAIESAYVDNKTFDVADTVLETIEPSINFETQTSHALAQDGTDALAADDEVCYFGETDQYSCGSTSESEKSFGVYVDKGAGGGTDYFIDGASADW